jgi:hypothetical protein
MLFEYRLGNINHLGSVMDMVLTSNMVNHEIDHQTDTTREYKIGTIFECRIVAKPIRSFSFKVINAEVLHYAFKIKIHGCNG